MSKVKIKPKLEQVPICDMVGEIAIHYGFNVIKPPQITNDDISKSKQFKDFDHYEDADEKVALTRWYIEERFDLEPQPVSILTKNPCPAILQRKKLLLILMVLRLWEAVSLQVRHFCFAVFYRHSMN